MRQGTATVDQRASAEDRRELAAAAVASPLPGSLEPPRGLPVDQRKVWLELAPHAIAARTLTLATVLAFRDLCEVVCVKRDLIRRIGQGYEVETEIGMKAHPLLTHYRTILQRVEAGLARFKLAPIGKDFDDPGVKPPVDPFDEFDDAQPPTHAAH